MQDTSSVIAGITTFAAMMAGLSIAVERAVGVIKGAVPLLSNPWPKNDEVRSAILKLIAAAVGALIASQMPGQIKSALPPGLGADLHWQQYAVIGLISSGGSGAWNYILTILGALKTKQVALAGASNAAQPQPAAKAAGAAV